MNRPWTVPALALIGALLAAALGGMEPFGRLALRAGAPALAAPLMDDPALRGAALYRAGRYAEAAASFAEAGPAQTYNLGNAEAQAGRYAEALLAYDTVLIRDPDHADARANLALVAALYGGTKLDLANGVIDPFDREGPTLQAPEGEGGARAAGTGAESDQSATSLFTPQLQSGSGLRRVPNFLDDAFIAATGQWLATLPDAPGEYLAARLKAEQAQRKARGEAPPESADPW